MAGLGTGLITEQKQVMKIHPAQLQKIEILQMSTLELEEKIRTELMENPVLEISEKGKEETDTYRDTQDNDPYSSHEEVPGDSYDDRDYWELHGSSAAGNHAASGDGIAAFEKFYRREETLGEYLLKQLGYIKCTDEVKRAAGYIIYSLSSSGLLDTELGEISGMAACSHEDAESALEIVQSLDPPGVGARSIEECLCLQLDPEDELTEDAMAVINGYLREIAVGNIKAITRSLGITAERLIQIIEVIRTLDPKPCSRFADNLPVQYMDPDVYADLVNGDIIVYLAGSQPQLCLSAYYSSLLKSSEDPAVIEYLKERIDSASRFIQNIEQRNRTILNVTRAIMTHQRQFLDFGAKALRPLTMQEVADELDISVSTVSRAISGKYIHCGGSTYAIKQFFSSEVGGKARDSVLERIRELIAEEDPAHPLSDQKIADILAGENIDISRRTVAKYRDSAGILPTSMRKTDNRRLT
ncbi:MAG: RNA polymerase factor sigma-54 [Mogibacterium sp.]|nr:RNA polymerase factor sigma-54 [Mogibacterium sp.]